MTLLVGVILNINLFSKTQEFRRTFKSTIISKLSFSTDSSSPRSSKKNSSSSQGVKTSSTSLDDCTSNDGSVEALYSSKSTPPYTKLGQY